jgi:uncharacterized Ntn-hydrolase superfamily protein
MTFSIVARCETTGMFGLAVSSSSPAVAARCAYAEAGVGAIASQNVTDPTLGPLGLSLMKDGASAQATIEELQNYRSHMTYRQVLAVDINGTTAIHSGSHALGICAEASDRNVACAGNMLAAPDVAQAMVDAFNASTGHLGDRLTTAMKAAMKAGGEAGPVHSAGMKLVHEVPWPIADLRVDWTEEDPIEDLAALWNLYKPQLADYVTRAIDPSAAPSYGVPGDE